MLTNGLNVGFPQQTGNEKQSLERKNTDCLLKKKFHVQWSVKKVMLTIFYNMNESIPIDFLEKDAPLNSDSLTVNS